MREIEFVLVDAPGCCSKIWVSDVFVDVCV